MNWWFINTQFLPNPKNNLIEKGLHSPKWEFNLNNELTFLKTQLVLTVTSTRETKFPSFNSHSLSTSPSQFREPHYMVVVMVQTHWMKRNDPIITRNYRLGTTVHFNREAVWFRTRKWSYCDPLFFPKTTDAPY